MLPGVSSIHATIITFACHHIYDGARKLAESTAISYPYSMREAIAVARHLEKFPKDSYMTAFKEAGV